MRIPLPIVLLFLMACQQKTTIDVSKKKDVAAVHQKAILVDTHNDFLTKTIVHGAELDTDLKGKTHSDLMRLQQGGVDVQFFSVWCAAEQENPFAYANRMMDSLDAVVQRNPEIMAKPTNSKELLSAVENGKLASLFGIEGGHMMEDNLDNLEAFYSRGVRYMTLTHNNSTDWATSATYETANPEAPNKGLSEFGKDVVRKMNELGMLVDVSHVGEKTFWDVIETTSKPIIASHSSVYELCNHPRNLKDAQIKAIANNGGVIQVNFFPLFVDPDYAPKFQEFLKKYQPEIDSLMSSGTNEYLAMEAVFKEHAEEHLAYRPPLSKLMEHIDYIVKLVGVDYVGLGSDFDGIFSTPEGLDDVTSYPLITQDLVDRGYSDEDIYKILGGNLLRVLNANEQ